MSVASRRVPGLRIGVVIAALALAACQEAESPMNPAAVSSTPVLDRTTAGETSDLGSQLAALRRATVAFHDTAAASAAGYNAKLTPCWYFGSVGAMGYHYGNPALIDGTADLWNPEILVYAPTGEGGLGLVALEYIVPIAAWTGATPPSLLGRDFERNDALGLYALHVWLWRHNPSGTFADWNPNVSCAHAPDSEDRS
ncbi:MAG TPA: hypothetical protein VJ992_08850 [Gemmatimonadales bacterium]|nr:hypothetical protein [Gemmatimonadales bacterium]